MHPAMAAVALTWGTWLAQHVGLPATFPRSSPAQSRGLDPPTPATAGLPLVGSLVLVDFQDLSTSLCLLGPSLGDHSVLVPSPLSAHTAGSVPSAVQLF